jgi:hypothetical protein
MSQAGSLLFGGSGTQVGSTIVADTGSATANAQGTLNGLGGSNMNTEGSSNNVTVNLDSSITIDDASIGNISITSNVISSLDANGDIIFDPDGTGKVNAFYLNDNAICYFDSNKNLQATTSATDGQVLIGATGAAPVASTLTAGSGISITNAPGSITIAGTGTGIGGVSSWVFLDYEVVGTPYTQVMAANTGYIVRWLTGSPLAGYTNNWLKFQFPTQANRSQGDFYVINVLQGSGKGVSGSGFNSTGYNIVIEPRPGETVQAPFQNDLFIQGPIYANAGKDPSSSSGTRLENGNITFLCTKPESTGSGPGSANFHVVASQNHWVY